MQQVSGSQLGELGGQGIQEALECVLFRNGEDVQLCRDINVPFICVGMMLIFLCILFCLIHGGDVLWRDGAQVISFLKQAADGSVWCLVHIAV